MTDEKTILKDRELADRIWKEDVSGFKHAAVYAATTIVAILVLVRLLS